MSKTPKEHQIGNIVHCVPGDNLELGQLAYESYCKASDGKSLVSGQELPHWDVLDQRIKGAWAFSAGCVAAQVKQDIAKRVDAEFERLMRSA